MALLLGGCAHEAAPVVVVEAPKPANLFRIDPAQSAMGEVGTYVTQPGDTLLDVAMRYDLGYTQLIAANRDTDPWSPPPGRRISLPSFYLLPSGPRRGIVINVAQQRLYYFPPDGRSVETYPIGTSVQGRATPIGMTKIVAKRDHPTWYPPPSIREEKPELPAAVPAGPDNPLGEYALNLGWPGYLIHGTNKPYGIGRNVSHGCIQLYPEDIDRLFHKIPVGTPVRVVNEEIETAWIGDELYLAAYPNKKQIDELGVESGSGMTPSIPRDLRKTVAKAAGAEVRRVDWKKAEEAALHRSGIPVRITIPAISASR